MSPNKNQRKSFTQQADDLITFFRSNYPEFPDRTADIIKRSFSRIESDRNSTLKLTKVKYEAIYNLIHQSEQFDNFGLIDLRDKVLTIVRKHIESINGQKLKNK